MVRERARTTATFHSWGVCGCVGVYGFYELLELNHHTLTQTPSYSFPHAAHLLPELDLQDEDGDDDDQGDADDDVGDHQDLLLKEAAAAGGGVGLDGLGGLAHLGVEPRGLHAAVGLARLDDAAGPQERAAAHPLLLPLSIPAVARGRVLDLLLLLLVVVLLLLLILLLSLVVWDLAGKRLPRQDGRVDLTKGACMCGVR